MKIFWVTLMLSFGISSVQAATLTSPAGHRLDWQLPSGWQVLTEPPAELVAEIALHISHEATRKGKKAARIQLEQAAARRLAANELLLYHQQSGAWISIDFSSSAAGSEPPAAKILELSARYALESLGNEEEVRDLDSSQQEFKLPGTEHTQLIVARYRHHEIATEFRGLIGYLPGEWFYLYATSYPEKADLKTQIDTLFKSLSFSPQHD